MFGRRFERWIDPAIEYTKERNKKFSALPKKSTFAPTLNNSSKRWSR